MTQLQKARHEIERNRLIERLEGEMISEDVINSRWCGLNQIQPPRDTSGQEIPEWLKKAVGDFKEAEKKPWTPKIFIPKVDSCKLWEEATKHDKRILILKDAEGEYHYPYPSKAEVEKLKRDPDAGLQHYDHNERFFKPK